MQAINSKKGSEVWSLLYPIHPLRIVQSTVHLQMSRFHQKTVQNHSSSLRNRKHHYKLVLGDVLVAPSETLSLTRKTFKACVPKNIIVSSKGFHIPELIGQVKYVSQILILESRNKDLGSNCYRPPIRSKEYKPSNPQTKH